MSYRERGDGEPLLLLSGLFVNGDTFRNVVPLLAEKFRCITPDLPLGAHEIPMSGSARLTVPLIADMVVALLDGLGIGRATFVGNDAGGVVCQLVLARHPERVERVVLACCDAFEDYPPCRFKVIKWLPYVPGSVWLIGRMTRIRAIRRTRIGHGAIMRDDPEPAVLESYLSPGRDRSIRRDISALLRSIDTSDTLDAARTFPSFPRPVLVAWAGQDRLFAPSTPTRLVQAFPNARLVTIAGSLTFIPEDEPDVLAREIIGFIESNPASTADLALANGARR
jgi:pimeloyl-ACP methyl ester carboxylesterase